MFGLGQDNLWPRKASLSLTVKVPKISLGVDINIYQINSTESLCFFRHHFTNLNIVREAITDLAMN